jgi:hypothetical protein
MTIPELLGKRVFRQRQVRRHFVIMQSSLEKRLEMGQPWPVIHI